MIFIGHIFCILIIVHYLKMKAEKQKAAKVIIIGAGLAGLTAAR